MNIQMGFQIETPAQFVPWGTSEHELIDLLGNLNLRKVTHGYYTIPCATLGGLQLHIGFHFEPRHNGKLNELEFFRPMAMDLGESFREFQAHLERLFGETPKRTNGTVGFPAFRWVKDDCEIFHYVFDRFGPEEHVGIRKY